MSVRPRNAAALANLLAAEAAQAELPAWQLETNRAAFMDYLYELYERDAAEPGLRGTYTGLYERYCRQIGEYWAQRQIGWWHQGF